MTTEARLHTANDAHYYTKTGEPCYEIAKAKGDGMRAPTIADARKLNLLPSVTTILKIFPRPDLLSWQIEQSVLAVLTTPRKIDPATGTLEADDVFVRRVLKVEEIQNQERDLARKKGIAIHAAIEAYFTGQEVDAEIRPWVQPAIERICQYGELVCAEKILVGDDYAGRTDIILKSPQCFWLLDAKASKTLPDPKKGAWKEHQIQAAAYAAAFHKKISQCQCGDNPSHPDIEASPIRTANVYISTVEAGKHVVCEHDPDWQKTYNSGFVPCLRLWQYLNSYITQP